MPPKKRKARSKKKRAKKSAAEKPGIPCICIEQDGFWFCMKALDDGSLTQCDGPFRTKEECEEHSCES